MREFGRPLRRWGDLRLVAVPAAGGGERYYVTAGGGTPLGAFPAPGPAAAFFDALRAVGADADEAEAAAAWALRAEGRRLRAEDERLRAALTGGPVDLAAHRQLRARLRAHRAALQRRPGRRPGGPGGAAP
jgi:hypothetical protein